MTGWCRSRECGTGRLSRASATSARSKVMSPMGDPRCPWSHCSPPFQPSAVGVMIEKEGGGGWLNVSDGGGSAPARSRGWHTVRQSALTVWLRCPRDLTLSRGGSAPAQLESQDGQRRPSCKVLIPCKSPIPHTDGPHTSQGVLLYDARGVATLTLVACPLHHRKRVCRMIATWAAAPPTACEVS